MANEKPDNEKQDYTELAAVLVGHRKGRAHDQASRLLRDAVEGVKLTGRKGHVTVKLEVTRMKNNPRVVVISDKITAVVPEEKEDSIWFTDDDGGLHRNDPAQLRMEYGTTSESAREGN